MNHPMRSLSIALLAATLAPAVAPADAFAQVPAKAPAESGYHVVGRLKLGGEGGWDYVAFDPVRHRLFVSHGTEVDVVNPSDGRLLGRIPNTPGVHGIALAQGLGRGYVSDGRDSTVTVFDLATLDTVMRVKVTGRNPDAILYDSVSARVFTFNGGSDDATALDARTGRVLGTLPLGGKPEFAVADGRGGVYVNIEDKAELVHFDARKLGVLHRWKLEGCEEPSGLAYDRAHGRLFSTCGNAVLAVTDAASGRQVASVPIGKGVDAGAFDPATQLVFASNGEGTLTVIHEDAPDRYRVVATVPTERGARTMALDPATHRLYLPTADFGPPPAPTPERPRPRPSVVPGSFRVLVVAR